MGCGVSDGVCVFLMGIVCGLWCLWSLWCLCGVFVYLMGVCVCLCPVREIRDCLIGVFVCGLYPIHEIGDGV